MRDVHLLKQAVHEYWNQQACDTHVAASSKFSREYFEEIEQWRYTHFPEIFGFCQFTRFHAQKVLEVGVGAGTDFLQWVRAGARAYGVDLTEEAIEHVLKRLEVYGVSAEDLRVADAESLPYDDGTFDLVYSWGVLHHTPDPLRALDEIIRITKPHGRIKLMVYNRYSLIAVYKWILFGLLRGRPFRSLSWIFWHCQESVGTKAFTAKEIRGVVSSRPVRIVQMQTITTYHDLLRHKPVLALVRWVPYVIGAVLGFDKVGSFLIVELERSIS